MNRWLYEQQTSHVAAGVLSGYTCVKVGQSADIAANIADACIRSFSLKTKVQVWIDYWGQSVTTQIEHDRTGLIAKHAFSKKVEPPATPPIPEPPVSYGGKSVH